MNYNETSVPILQAWIERQPVESWQHHLSLIADEDRRDRVRSHLEVCYRLVKKE